MCARQCKKGKQFYAVLPYHISKEKTRQVVSSCHPFKPLTQPRACCCQGHTLPPCCLSLQAKDSLWLSSINSVMRWRSALVRPYWWLYAKKSAKIARKYLRHILTKISCPQPSSVHCRNSSMGWSSKQFSRLPWTVRSPATKGIYRVGFRALDFGPDESHYSNCPWPAPLK